MLADCKIQKIIVSQTDDENDREKNHTVRDKTKKRIADHVTGEPGLIEYGRPGLLVSTSTHGVSARVSVMPVSMVGVVARS